MPDFIPTTAPFNEEQRAWLNGFFSGLMGLQQVSPQELTRIGSQVLTTGGGEAVGTLEPAEDSTEEFPWHDPAMPLDERMELASDRPLPRKLMAAMAQLDCGSCGYVCQTYAESLANGSETNDSLCSPGGRSTRQMVKLLLKEAIGSTTAAPTGTAPVSQPKADRKSSESTYNRVNPYPARLLESRTLNQTCSSKDVRHVVIDLADSGLEYRPGDALGICPVNCRDLTSAIIRQLQALGDCLVQNPDGSETTLELALRERCCLRDPSDELLELLINRATDPVIRSRLQQDLAEGLPAGCDVLEVLERAGPAAAGIPPAEFLATLGPLNPRLYSIASSPRKVGTQVHLTVGTVTYERGGRLRKGVASTLLGGGLAPGEIVNVFVQPNHGGFSVPTDDSIPMIMIGPGTGIAPFMAFLQERECRRASGENWLFFGDQHRHCDFLYERELIGWQQSGLLTRFDTAFSRDGEHKVYVQNRMEEHAAELFAWLERGAHFYVCGDAARMARDVEQTLLRIIEMQAGTDASGARRYLKELATHGRYVRDVY